jgi:DNA-binding GntR family transcriptional regulator
MYRYRFEYIKDEERHDNLVEEHRMIYESILHGDKEKAAEASKLHIDNQEQSIIRQIRLEQEQNAKHR